MLLQSGRLLGTHNFISGDTNVFGGYGSHGNSVLSIMAANHPDTLVGTAPHANYWLFTTEDISQETPIEMDYWLMAAEFADSVGVHLINTSVSYTTFDNSQNKSCASSPFQNIQNHDKPIKIHKMVPIFR